jgi:hypothetical protein
MAQFDLKKLTTLDRVVAGAAAIAIITLFLPWYGASGLGYSVSVNGFGAGFLGWFGAILIIASGAFLVVVRSGMDVTEIKWPPARVVLVLSAVGTALVAIRWLTVPSGGETFGAYSFHYGAMYGMIVTLLLGVVQAICAFRLPGSHAKAAAA